ncbi:MAG: hypothetical protein ACJ74O_04150 [Frankiaceae bacterium]
MTSDAEPTPARRAASAVTMVLDVAAALAALAARLASDSSRAGLRLAGPAAPVARRALRPPLVPERYWPETLLLRTAERGHQERAVMVSATARTARALVPRILDATLDQIDLTQLVIDRVDVDAIVDRVDLEAIVERIDIDAIVAKLDIDAIVDRLDIDAIVERIDLDGIVGKLDIEAIVNRIDLDAIVGKLDIEAIVNRIDLDAIVDRIDIDAILDKIDLDATVARVDIEAVIQRVDLVELARYIIDGVDLPEIIRDSTGTMASEGIRGVRRQTIDADERVGRLVDRMLLRRQARRTETVAVDLPEQAPNGRGPT